MNGFATVLKNAFLGSKPHELTVCITTGALGDIRRFAVANMADARTRCADLGVNLRA